MTKKQSYTIPPQESAEDTSNWDDRAFTIMRPPTMDGGKPTTSYALMEPDNFYKEYARKNEDSESIKE